MEIDIDGNIIKVIIVKKNIKNMYFRIDENLNLLVTVNRWVGTREIERVIKSKYEPIKKMYYSKLKEKDQDAYFYYLGNKYNVIYEDHIKEVYFDNENIYTKDDKMLDKFYLKKCREVFESRLEQQRLLFPDINVTGLKIRKMKTRWGVCNRRERVITLNSELLKRDVTLIDYVIIHELCHFYHPDHSKRFWETVSKYYPYYKKARTMLRDI